METDLQMLGVRGLRDLVTDRTKMERYCSTGQSSQRAVAPMEEEEEEEGGGEEEKEDVIMLLDVWHLQLFPSTSYYYLMSIFLEINKIVVI